MCFGLSSSQSVSLHVRHMEREIRKQDYHTFVTVIIAFRAALVILAGFLGGFRSDARLIVFFGRRGLLVFLRRLRFVVFLCRLRPVLFFLWRFILLFLWQLVTLLLWRLIRRLCLSRVFWGIRAVFASELSTAFLQAFRWLEAPRKHIVWCFDGHIVHFVHIWIFLGDTFGPVSEGSFRRTSGFISELGKLCR